MKKIILTFLVIVLFVPLYIKASSCDASKIVIDSIFLEESTGSASEKSSATINENTINIDLSMSNVGDSVTYKLDVKNESDDDLELNSDSFGIKKSDYINYSLNDEESVLVRSKTMKTVYLKIEYLSEVPVNLMGSDGYKEEEDFTLSLSTLTNPKTGDTRIVLIVITLAFSILLFVILKKGNKPTLLSLVGLLLIIPIILHASCEIEFNIKSKVEISKIAEFDAGHYVNYKMHALENNHNRIQKFERSESLPDNIRELANNELIEAESVTVSDEELNTIMTSINESYVYDGVSFKVIDGLKQICYLEGDKEYCNYEYYFKDLSNLYLIKEKGSDEVKYLYYSNEISKFEIYNEEEFSNIIKDEIIADKKKDVLKHVFSSKDSDYLIYGWYDSDSETIFYYCEKDEVYLNKDSSYMFNEMYNLKGTSEISNLNTSKVRNMSYMFDMVAIDKSLDLDLSSWNVSNVIDMSHMFDYYYENYYQDEGTTYKLNLSNWDTSNVRYTDYMFNAAGSNNENVIIDGLSGWDTSNVINMEGMFQSCGVNSSNIDIGNLSNWKTSNVLNMNGMFRAFGKNSNSINLDLSSWDTSRVISMFDMFSQIGSNSNVWSIGDLSNWRTSNVQNMGGMFYAAGENVATWSIGDLSRWDTSNVTYMARMFDKAGRSSSTWSVGDLSSWRTSNVTDMSYMFSSAAYNAENVSFNLSNWDVSKVQNFEGILESVGYNSRTVDIDISGWTLNIERYLSRLFTNLGYNAYSVNLNLSNWNLNELKGLNNGIGAIGKNANSIDINMSNWNLPKYVNDDYSTFSSLGYFVSNVRINVTNWNFPILQNLSSLFQGVGTSSTSLEIIGLSTWDTSNITNMANMFRSLGQDATTWNIGDLSNWNTSNVTNMSEMFDGAGKNASEWNIGNLSNWDTSKVQKIDNMFLGAGKNATNIINIGTIDIYATDLVNFMRECSSMKAILNIHNKPTQYTSIFYNSFTVDGSGVVINYTSDVTNIDSIVNSNPRAVKGEIIE